MKKSKKQAIVMASQFESIVKIIGTVILGKSDQIRLALTCLFARGHLLIEDLPGIGKTTLAKVLSRSLGLDFRRVQFTADLLPADILGISVFDRKTSAFVFHPGPVFTQVLLADEINRATPKTQSALLEAMEEKQVTLEGKTRILDKPFFVIATQNPLEQAGTFPLPESQMDRFLMRIAIGYPGRDAEQRLLKGEGVHEIMEKIAPCLTHENVCRIQDQIAQVHASDPLLSYLQDLLIFTRTSGHFYVGLSPRAGIALLQASKSWAFLHGREHVLPEDLQKIMPYVVGHRLRSKEDLAEFPKDRLDGLLAEVPIP